MLILSFLDHLCILPILAKLLLFNGGCYWRQFTGRERNTTREASYGT